MAATCELEAKGMFDRESGWEESFGIYFPSSSQKAERGLRVRSV